MYEGEWKAGEEEGRGTMRYADGDVYEGEWKAGLEEGRGTCRYVGGGVYEGDWKAGKRKLHTRRQLERHGLPGFARTGCLPARDGACGPAVQQRARERN